MEGAPNLLGIYVDSRTCGYFSNFLTTPENLMVVHDARKKTRCVTLFARVNPPGSKWIFIAFVHCSGTNNAFLPDIDGHYTIPIVHAFGSQHGEGGPVLEPDVHGCAHMLLVVLRATESPRY